MISHERGHHSVATQIHEGGTKSSFPSSFVKLDTRLLPLEASRTLERYIPTGRGFQEFVGSYSGAGDHYEHTISGTRWTTTGIGGRRREDLLGRNGTHSTDVAEQEAISPSARFRSSSVLIPAFPSPTHADASRRWTALNDPVSPGTKRRKLE